MFDNQGLRRRKFNSSVALLDDSPPQGGGWASVAGSIDSIDIFEDAS